MPDDRYLDVLEHIRATWPLLITDARDASADIDAIVDPEENIFLPEPYVVPGGIFDTMFYWDSYFTMLGLRHDPVHADLLRSMVDNCVFMVEHYGRVLNSNKKVWSSRSQLPFLTSMIELCRPLELGDEWYRHAYDAAATEYADYWTSGNHLLDNGLSRFYEDSGDDYMTRHTEASWDMSPRFTDDNATSLAPVDLNANLFVYERHLAAESTRRGDSQAAEHYEQLAAERRSRMLELMWDTEDGLFYDYDTSLDRRTDVKSVATFVPLWAGIADDDIAARSVDALALFETKHGVATCDRDYGYADRQWNHPFGWAPLHWMIWSGLRNYGYASDADRIARSWLELNAEVFRRTGAMWEKYDVVRGTVADVLDRYENQVGFGWTNGVFADLEHSIGDC